MLLAVTAGLIGNIVTFKRLFIVIAAIVMPLLAYIVGINSIIFLGIYAALVWLPISLNYYFFDVVLLQATLPELAIYFGLLLMLFFGYRDRWKSLRKIMSTPLILPLVGFALGGIIAYLTGPGVRAPETFMYLRRAAFYNLAIYLVIVNLLRKPAHGMTLLKALVMGGTVAGIFLSFRIGGTWDPISRLTQGRAVGYYDLRDITSSTIYAQVATYLSVLFSIALSLTLNCQQRWERVFFGLITVLLGILLVVSEGRAGWVAGGVSGFAVFWLSTYRRKIAIWKYLAIVLLFVIAFYVLPNSGFMGELYYLSNRFSTLLNFQGDIGFNGRIELWKQALKLLAEYPFGVGFNYFYEVSLRTAHNEILQLALGSGILGLFCILAFFSGVIRKFIRGLQDPDHNIQFLCITALGVCMALLVNGITDNPSTNSVWTWPVIWITIAAAIGALRVDQTVE